MIVERGFHFQMDAAAALARSSHLDRFTPTTKSQKV